MKLSAEDSAWLQAKMQEHKTIEQSFVLAQKLSHEAMEAMKEDKELVMILESMIQRSY
jgi:octaprenyl-diphosphate synthase